MPSRVAVNMHRKREQAVEKVTACVAWLVGGTRQRRFDGIGLSPEAA